jgi:prevent-host-death family protein
MATVSVHEAKTHLSRLLKQVEAGEEVAITRRNQVIARIVPSTAKKKPLYGALKGKVKFDLDDGFFDPLPEEELKAWGLA